MRACFHLQADILPPPATRKNRTSKRQQEQAETKQFLIPLSRLDASCSGLCNVNLAPQAVFQPLTFVRVLLDGLSRKRCNYFFLYRVFSRNLVVWIFFCFFVSLRRAVVSAFSCCCHLSFLAFIYLFFFWRVCVCVCIIVLFWFIFSFLLVDFFSFSSSFVSSSSSSFLLLHHHYYHYYYCYYYHYYYYYY